MMCDIQNTVFQDSNYDNFIGFNFLLKSAVLGNPRQKAIFNMTCSSKKEAKTITVHPLGGMPAFYLQQDILKTNS